MKITATVITLNEERDIAEALESLWWADEIIVVDSESTDETVQIARRFTQHVYVRPWPGYAAQKNWAADQASHDWVLSLDADERVSPELAREIQQVKLSSTVAAGFEMPRLSFYLGEPIRHSGWYPDYKLRLYNRRTGRFHGDFVHEAVKVRGVVERLTSDILHYTIRSVSEHHLRMDRYTTLAAQELFARGERASIGSILLSPIAHLFRSLVLKAGFLDGLPGLAIAYFAAHYAFLRALKLWELDKLRSPAFRRNHSDPPNQGRYDQS